MLVVYCEVTQDEMSLPIFVCEYIDDLCYLSNTKKEKIYNNISRDKRRVKKGNVAITKRSFPRFVRVEIPDGELITDEMWEHYKRWKDEQGKSIKRIQ